MAADSIRNGGMMVVMHLSPASPGGGGGVGGRTSD